MKSTRGVLFFSGMLLVVSGSSTTTMFAESDSSTEEYVNIDNSGIRDNLFGFTNFQQLRGQWPTWIAFVQIADYCDFTIDDDALFLLRQDRRNGGKVSLAEVDYFYNLLLSSSSTNSEALVFVTHHNHQRELFRFTEVYVQYRGIQGLERVFQAKIDQAEAEMDQMEVQVDQVGRRIDAALSTYRWLTLFERPSLSQIAEWNHQVHRLRTAIGTKQELVRQLNWLIEASYACCEHLAYSFV